MRRLGAIIVALVVIASLVYTAIEASRHGTCLKLGRVLPCNVPYPGPTVTIGH